MFLRYFLKVFIEFVNIAYIVYVLVFKLRHVGSQLPKQGLKPHLLEGKLLTTGPPGKSSFYISDNSPLLDVSFAGICSQSMSCLSIFLMTSLLNRIFKN